LAGARRSTDIGGDSRTTLSQHDCTAPISSKHAGIISIINATSHADATFRGTY
jgi:hypothetical protein